MPNDARQPSPAARLPYLLDLLWVMTHKDLKVRYKSSALGYLWSLANPLAFAVVFYYAFKLIIRVPVENYPLFLILGLFPWQWLSNSMGISATALLANAPLIKKNAFPRHVIVGSIVLQDAIHFLLAIPVVVFFCSFITIRRVPTGWRASPCCCSCSTFSCTA